MRNGTSLMLNPANTGGSECSSPPPPINDSIIARYDANCWDGVTWSDLSGNEFHVSPVYSPPTYDPSAFGDVVLYCLMEIL